MTSPVEIGALIAGKYRVERVLGQGGMGVVVVAMHDDLDQRVAIKFLLPDALKDPEWVARFSREARAAARIKSEHAVKVYDVGKLDNGAPYMVMEYLEGRDLQTTLNERHRLPTSEAVEYLLQACEALAEAHSAGIVHRDLKPANLFVTHRTDGSPCVKILDFGISKMTSLTSAKEQTVTNTQAIVGSPLYMSPEQMRASKNVDKRTDIWSLGIILQELVSGLPSFVANTTAELCAMVLTAPPTPLGDTLPDAPPGLHAVIAKCLAKAPDERYASVADLARALARFGPASCRTSVERIVRLTATPAARAELTSIDREREASQPGISGNLVAFSQTEIVDATLPTAVGAPNASVSGPQPAPAAGAATAAAWGGTLPSVRKSRLPIYLGGGAAFVALAVLGFVIASRNTTHTGSSGSSAPVVTSIATADSPKPSAHAATAAVSAPPTPPSATAIDVTALPTAAPGVTGARPTTIKPTTPASAASAKKPPPATVDTAGFGGRN